MKKILKYILVSALVAGLWSCSKDDDTTPEPGPVVTTITLGADGIEFVQAGGKMEISVISPERPQVTDMPEWITKAKTGIYNNHACVITLTAELNPAYDPREGTVTVASGSLTATFTVTQSGRTRPTPPEDTGLTTTLVTESPTANAQALFDYMLGIYGQKTLSAVIADVNWNHNQADAIYNNTGKYPAINCYDFIHILYSGENWINYSDLTPVTEWADAGGIVSLMWHFNVPVSRNAGNDDVTCTASLTEFSPSNALTSGTWENRWFYAQMDKVVDVILALQEKDIAALWRPFHEGAGNACAKHGGEVWFWWGKEGPEVYKRLWNTMFEYFAEKGIRNLIWIWTTQNYNGNSNAYELDLEWYPGDGYVDMVGRDLYGYDAAKTASEYEIAKTWYPTKMIALAECGPDGSTACAIPSEAWAAGGKWSYFMPWYGDAAPDFTWWSAAMNSDDVITREGLPSDLFVY